jgi:ankyrin repeat protein
LSVHSLVIDRPNLLKQLLQRGANPNVMSTSGETSLSAAVQASSIRTIKMLLEAAADVQNGDVLHYAVEREGDELGVIRLLLSRGAPVNAIARQLRQSLLRGTPLHKACRLGKHEVAELLLTHGADPKSTMMRESQIETTTPLDISRELKDERMIALLEDHRLSCRI